MAKINGPTVASNISDSGPLVEPKGYGILEWISKYLLFPLTPFFAGALVRFVHVGQFSYTVFNPEELSFSFALICFLGATAAQKLNGKGLRQTVSTIFFVGMALFLMFFALSITTSAMLSKTNEGLINNFINTISISSPRLYTPIYQSQRSECQRMLNWIFTGVSILGVVYSLLGVRFRNIYGLGEE